MENIYQLKICESRNNWIKFLLDISVSLGQMPRGRPCEGVVGGDDGNAWNWL